MPISATDLNKAYLAYFGRPADLTGKTYFATLEQADVIKAFDASAESKAVYGDNVASKVNAIYQNLFNRDAEPEGLVYWTTLINQGRVTAAGAALAILNGAQGTDTTAVTNKLAASEAFVAALNTTPELVGYSGMEAAASARSWLKAVGADAASLTAAIAGVDAAVTAAVAVGGVPGATFTLTAGVDNLVGTAGNDTFIGSIANPASVTGADQIVGGAGNDTLKIYGGVTLPTFSGIETLYFNAPGAGLASIAGFTEVTKLQIDNDSIGYGWTLNANQNIDLISVSGGSTVVTLPSTDASLGLGLNGVANAGAAVAVDLKGAGLATLNITTSGAASNVTLNNSAAAAALKTVNISGTAAVTLDANTNGLTGITTVNAANNTGNVSYVASDAKVVFTGGAGNDTVTFAATKFTADDKVNGGAGVDTIKINDIALTDGTTNQVKGINAATNVEVLAFGTAGVTLDAGLITSGINQFRADVGGGTYTLNNTNKSSVVEINAVTIGAHDFTIANKLGELTSNLKLTATAAAQADVAQLKLTGIGTLNIESALSGAGSQAAANSVVLTANSDNSVFTIKGSQALNFSGVQATTTGSTIDGSAATGKLGLTGSIKTDIIKGGAAADTFTTSGGNDVLTGGAGADVFLFKGGDAVVAGTANVVTITDFTAGTDKISFKGGADAFLTGLDLTATAVTLNTAQTIATAADLASVYAGISAIGVSTATTQQAALITVSAGAAAGTYLYVNDNTAAVTAAEDMLVKISLTGTLTAADFSFTA